MGFWNGTRPNHAGPMTREGKLWSFGKALTKRSANRLRRIEDTRECLEGEALYEPMPHVAQAPVARPECLRPFTPFEIIVERRIIALTIVPGTSLPFRVVVQGIWGNTERRLAAFRHLHLADAYIHHHCTQQEAA